MPVPGEGARVEISAFRRALERLERGIRLPLRVEERRRKHRDRQAEPDRALQVLAAPVVFARRNLDHAAHELSRELATLAQPHERRRVEIVEAIPLVDELLIQEHAEAAQQHGIHVGVETAVVVQRENPEEIAVAVHARVALAVDLGVGFERRPLRFDRRVVDAQRDMRKKRPQPLVAREILVRPQHQRTHRLVLRREERLDRQRLLAAEPPDLRPEAAGPLTPVQVKRDRLDRTGVGERAAVGQRFPPVVVQLVVCGQGDRDQ